MIINLKVQLVPRNLRHQQSFEIAIRGEPQDGAVRYQVLRCDADTIVSAKHRIDFEAASTNCAEVLTLPRYQGRRRCQGDVGNRIVYAAPEEISAHRPPLA